jgi:L-ascorbate metabolism protein UlaG (beta-lactamase superfamily)
LTDGVSTLLIDPVVTKPNLRHWILGSSFQSNENRVREVLSRYQISSVEGVLCSHTHFDHAVDVPVIARLKGAKVYGGESLKNLVHKSEPSVPYQEVQDGDRFQVGDFKVTFHRREHSPILKSLGWKFLPGLIEETFSSGFYDYHEGEIWSFYIEHPQGRILIDQGSKLAPSSQKYFGQVDVHFTGVANKESFEDLTQNNIFKVHAALVIPIHFDFFMLQSEWLESLRLPGMELERLESAVISNHQTFLIPKLGEPVKIK